MRSKNFCRITPSSLALLLGFIICFSACSISKKTQLWTSENVLKTVKFCPKIIQDSAYNNFSNAIEQSLGFYKAKVDQQFAFGSKSYSAEKLYYAYSKLKVFLSNNPGKTSLEEYLCKNFEFYRSPAGKALFTGYFEPELSGSKVQSTEYKFPVYGRPSDLVKLEITNLPLVAKDLFPGKAPSLRGRVVNQELIPYFDRSQIANENALAGRGLEIVWVKDQVGLFFLHIQGSGIVSLSDGSQIRIGYSDKNGHPYRAIGKLLIDEDLVPREEMSMQAIKKYLKENPADVNRVLNYNPSYIFFRQIDGPGPLGSLGKPLTPFHSIATDSSLYPHGALAFVEISSSKTASKGQFSGQYFVANQDTGGAITGPNRVDLFTGSSKQSGEIAGKLQSYGSLYFMAPRL